MSVGLGRVVPSVLVVEDDAATRVFLAENLIADRFAPVSATSAEEALEVLARGRPDAALVDVGLPGMSGLDLVSKIREGAGEAPWDTGMPILLISGDVGPHAAVRGFGRGADDYVAKPFHFEEVQARVQALLRRSGGWASSALACGPVTLDTRAQSVTVADRPVELTTFEYRILEHLMLKAGEVISKTDLTEHLYEQDFERDSNVIEVFVGRLRRKLDPDETLKPIETLRGRGYRFALPRNAS
jgi:two-component system, OmpR family, response regulator PhoP